MPRFWAHQVDVELPPLLLHLSPPPLLTRTFFLSLLWLCESMYLQSATKSALALHGRWFAGRMITVDYLQPEAYVAKFPEAAGRA